mmetsp:Transcript_9409/g.26986  ORF Transcript_9409/g.26986 Transcript_9409/m.26986 type:complete len:226 (-) Transcript_9409:109-786(-)
MASKRTFSFEDPPARSADSHGNSDYMQSGALPDFGSFGNIKFDSISPAIGIAQADKKYTPMSRGAEYLFDDTDKERSFGEHIQYYCGAAYLTGMGVGGALGFFEGLRKGQNLPTPKLKQNAVVNAMSKRGPTLAANLAVFALMFTFSERMALYSRDKDDVMNSIIAASATGFMFNCTSGARKCLVYTALGGAGMGLAALSGNAATVLHRAKVNPFSLGQESAPAS